MSHIVDRVLGFFSNRPNWDPPPPHPQASVFPPVWFPVGGGEGGTVASGRGGAQWGRGDRHCGTLGKYVFCDVVNLKVHKIENFFVSDYGICVISLLVMYK